MFTRQRNDPTDNNVYVFAEVPRLVHSLKSRRSSSPSFSRIWLILGTKYSVFSRIKTRTSVHWASKFTWRQIKAGYNSKAGFEAHGHYSSPGVYLPDRIFPRPLFENGLRSRQTFNQGNTVRDFCIGWIDSVRERSFNFDIGIETIAIPLNAYYPNWEYFSTHSWIIWHEFEIIFQKNARSKSSILWLVGEDNYEFRVFRNTREEVIQLRKRCEETGRRNHAPLQFPAS